MGQRFKTFQMDCCVSVAVQELGADMFFFSYPNFTLYLLSKEPICIPMKLVLCLDCSFVPGVASFHKMTNLWGDKRIRSSVIEIVKDTGHVERSICQVLGEFGRIIILVASSSNK